MLSNVIGLILDCMRLLFNGSKFYLSMSNKELKTLLAVVRYIATFIAGILSHIGGEQAGLF